MFSEKKKNYLIPAIVIIVILLLMILPIEVPNYYKTRAKIIPSQEWILFNSNGGRLQSNVLDHKIGANNNLKFYEFERGDVVELIISEKLKSSNKIEIGDTIGYLTSNELQRKIADTRNSLESQLAKMQTLKVGDKPQEITLEKSKLEYAERALLEKQRFFIRQKELLKGDVISTQEYELAEGDVELAKLKVEIAKRNLDVVSSSEKQENIDYIKSKLAGYKKELDILNLKFKNLVITCPIKGFPQKITNSDTVAVIYNTDVLIWNSLIPENEIKQIFKNDIVTISTPDSTFYSKIEYKANVSTILNGRQFYVVSGSVENPNNDILIGVTEAKIYGKPFYIRDLVYDFFHQWII